MAGYRIPGPLRYDGEPIDEGTSALTRSSRPGPLGVDHCWPWGDRPDPELDYDSWGDRINREDLKIELAEEIAHLILDITGIFDPTPISDGNYALFCLAGGRWLDALVSTASIVPYIGDVSKIPRMLDYSRSIEKAIHLARIDITWRSRLRSVFTLLRSLLDKALAIEDELPDLTRKYLQEMRYEIDDFVTPHSMRELKPKAPANIEHAVPGRTPSKKAKSPKKEKTESETSEDALKEQSQDGKIGEKNVGGKNTDEIADGTQEVAERTRKVPNKVPVYTNLKEMDKHYVGEETGAVWGTKVKYLDDIERHQYQLHVKNGELYDAKDNLFDTANARSAFGGQGNAIFVMDEYGSIYASTVHSPGKFHHSSFLSGQPVASAGEIVVKNGVLKEVTRRSGHYQPTSEQLEQFSHKLNESGVGMANVSIGAGF